MVRREKWSIVGALLIALDNEAQRSTTPRMTNVASRANIAYDRMMLYIADLQRSGLVTDEKFAHLTPKGREFLHHYKRWMELLDRFGMAPPKGGHVHDATDGDLGAKTSTSDDPPSPGGTRS